MKKKIYHFFIKILLSLYSFLYRLISLLAIRTEDGIHPKHRLTKYHQYFLNNVNSKSIVLDIGCGQGELAYDLSKKAHQVIGIDISHKNIKIAQGRYSAKNVNYYFGDATKYRFEQKFDIIILSNVLEHLRNRIKFLNKIKKLAPKILIRVPMINRDWITLYKKELDISWKLDKSHFIEYTEKSFKDELSRAGLKIIQHSIQFGEIWAVVKSK